MFTPLIRRVYEFINSQNTRAVKILKCENFVYFINSYKNKGVYLNWASIKKCLSEGFKNSLERGEKLA